MKPGFKHVVFPIDNQFSQAVTMLAANNHSAVYNCAFHVISHSVNRQRNALERIKTKYFKRKFQHSINDSIKKQ